MAIPLNINGAVFEYPENFDETWGVNATGWAQAVTNGMLQRQGGTFPLTADVDFGASFGLKAAYFESRITNPSHSGLVRLAKTDTVAWRNNANSADLPLGIDGSDNLTFNGVPQSFTGAVNPGIANQLAYYATSSAAVSGLTAITANRALISNASGLPIASSVTDTTLAFLDATSSVQTQLNSISTVANAALPKAGGTMSGNIDMGSNRIQNLADGVNPQDAATVNQVSSSTPPGTVVMYAGASAPSGWLLCDGSSYATASHPALFAAILYAYGGAGANFNVPNLINNVPVGQGGSIAPSLGSTSGATSVTVLQNSHTHTITHKHLTSIAYNFNDGDLYAQNPPFNGTSTISSTTWARQAMAGGGGATDIPFPFTNDTDTPNSGSTIATNQASSVVQPSIGLNFIIKT